MSVIDSIRVDHVDDSTSRVTTDVTGGKTAVVLVFDDDGTVVARSVDLARSPEPDPEPEPNRVRIGEAEWQLAAVDPTPSTHPSGFISPTWAGRGTDQLIAVTTASGPKTAFNQYGALVVVGPGGLVGLVVDQARASAGNHNVSIPTGGYVLAGHGAAANFILTNAREGLPVSFRHVEPIPGPGGGTLPAWVVAGYWQQYQGPRVAEVHPAFNVLYASFILGNGGQTMTFQPVVQDDASFRREVRAAQERGVVWGASVGGGVKAEFATVIRTQAEAVRAADGISRIVESYGFQLIDYDLENGPGGFTQDGLLEVSRRLRSRFGPGFGISFTPRPYESFYYAIAAAHEREGLLSLLQFQFYDSREYNDPAFLRAHVPLKLDEAQRAGVPWSKMVIGAITRTGYPNGHNTIGVYRDVVAAMKGSRGIRGSFIWETSMDRSEGWSFATTMAGLA